MPDAHGHRALFERTLAGVSLESLGGRILYANPALARMLGYPGPALLEGKLAETLFADAGDAERHRGAVLTTGSSSEELRLGTATGGEVWVMANTVASGDPVTGDLEILHTVIDITAQKASRERL